MIREPSSIPKVLVQTKWCHFMHRKAPGKPKALFLLLDAGHQGAVGGFRPQGT